MKKLLTASLLAAGIVAAAPAYAAGDPVLLGSTADASQWQAKYLGADEDDWKNQLASTAYEGVYVVSYGAWETPDASWISLYEGVEGAEGFYSYMTVIDDSGSTGALEALNIKNSSDNLLHAIVINGVVYAESDSPYVPGKTFEAFRGWTTSDLTGISNWNNGGSNTIEFIIYNGTLGYDNPTGFAAEIYSTTAVPEPETYAMMLAGLGIVGAIARRRRHS